MFPCLFPLQMQTIYFVDVPQFGVSNVSSWIYLGFTLSQNLHRTDVIVTVLPIKMHTPSLCPLTVVSCDYLVKVVSAIRFSTFWWSSPPKVAIFPFVTSKELVERREHPVPHSPSATGTNVHWSFSPESGITMMASMAELMLFWEKIATLWLRKTL